MSGGTYVIRLELERVNDRVGVKMSKRLGRVRGSHFPKGHFY